MTSYKNIFIIELGLFCFLIAGTIIVTILFPPEKVWGYLGIGLLLGYVVKDMQELYPKVRQSALKI